MKATKIENRDCYEVEYDGATGTGAIKAEFTNPDNDDVSDYKGADDGKFIVTVDPGYVGTADVVVTHEADGAVLDEGTVEFG